MSGYFPLTNVTPLPLCQENLHRNSCLLNELEVVKRDAIASIRMVVSCLSILGSVSIILSVLWRRILKNPKIHPIFVLSVADCLLGLSWVLGGFFWFSHLHGRWCYLPSLLTVILGCVSVNITVVYALVAYASIKQRDFTSVLSNMDQPATVWRPWKVATAYIIAWCLPIFLVLLSFGINGGVYGIVENADVCSCWCLPYFSNVVPLAHQADWASALYVFHVRKLLVTYGVVMGTTYLVVFILLVIVYSKILRHIRRVRRAHEQTHASYPTYGAVGTLLTRGHSQARKRVIYFLSVFIITGIANFALSCIFIVLESIELHRGVKIVHLLPSGKPPDHLSAWVRVFFYITQSLTAPLQGFLNALVYGWTRQDFIRVGKGRQKLLNDSFADDDSDFENSESALAPGNAEHYARGGAPDMASSQRSRITAPSHQLTRGKVAHGRQRNTTGGLGGDGRQRNTTGGLGGDGRQRNTTGGLGGDGRQRNTTGGLGGDGRQRNTTGGLGGDGRQRNTTGGLGGDGRQRNTTGGLGGDGRQRNTTGGLGGDGRQRNTTGGLGGDGRQRNTTGGLGGDGRQRNTTGGLGGDGRQRNTTGGLGGDGRQRNTTGGLGGDGRQRNTTGGLGGDGRQRNTTGGLGGDGRQRNTTGGLGGDGRQRNTTGGLGGDGGSRRTQLASGVGGRGLSQSGPSTAPSKGQDTRAV